MNDKYFVLKCDDDDVVSFPESSCVHKFKKFKDAVNNLFIDRARVASVINELLSPQLGISSINWFHKGIVCEVLQLGSSNWEKGKIRIKVTLEFCPDEPVIEEKIVSSQSESTLDDMRLLIK